MLAWASANPFVAGFVLIALSIFVLSRIRSSHIGVDGEWGDCDGDGGD